MLTTPATSRKTTSATRFSPCSDGELVERRREEPVGEQEARDRAHERGDEAAERGDDHDDHEQEHEQVARQRERVAELGEDERQQRRRAIASAHASARLRGETRDPVARPPRASVGSGRLVVAGRRDHVHVDRPRRADHVVDHRAAEQMRPPRLPARAEHDLGRVLGLRELHERRRDVGAREHAVLAAELVEQPPLLFERVARRGAQPVGGAHVARR